MTCGSRSRPIASSSAVLTYLACTNERPAEETLVEIAGMLEGTGAYPVIAEDLDDELRKAAMDRARKRMASFTANIHKLPIARGYLPSASSGPETGHLASWASDARAVEAAPALRLAPGASQAVSVDEILEALRRLDKEASEQRPQASWARRRVRR